MNFYKKLGEIRPNQLITTYGPGSIMDAVNDSLTVLDIVSTCNLNKETTNACNTLSLALAANGVAVVPSTYLYICEWKPTKFS